MGLIREPLDIDFVVDTRPLTTEEKETISAYIREYKARHSVNPTTEDKNTRSVTKQKKFRYNIAISASQIENGW